MADPVRDARLIARWAAGLDATGLLTRGVEAMAADEVARFDAAVTERAKRRPLSQITGEREFWGRAFRVTADTLDPRPETEVLVAAALRDGPGRRVLDLGTGTGCLLVSLLSAWPAARGVGVDVSAKALAVARSNVERHGLAERVTLVQGDWFEGVEGCYDVIVANPPYIPAEERASLSAEVRDNEPTIALTPEPDPLSDGLAAYRRIAAGLPAHMARSGRVYLEVGASQGAAVRNIIASSTGAAPVIVQDFDGRDRVVCVNCDKNSNTRQERR